VLPLVLAIAFDPPGAGAARKKTSPEDDGTLLCCLENRRCQLLLCLTFEEVQQQYLTLHAALSGPMMLMLMLMMLVMVVSSPAARNCVMAEQTCNSASYKPLSGMITEVLEQIYLVGLKKFVSLVQEIGVHLMRSRENSLVGSSTSLL
jgi:hypothetical protein